MKNIPALIFTHMIFLMVTADMQAQEARKETELLSDPNFRSGFNLNSPQPGKKVKVGVFKDGSSPVSPEWELAQWSSKYCISTAKPERLASGALSLSSDAKKITFFPQGNGDFDLLLAVNTEPEYGGRPRQKGEPWTHLLAEQRFKINPKIQDLEKVRFKISVKLVKAENKMGDDFQPNLHTAHFLFYLTVQNLNRKSSGYGDFLWFGVPLYDYRDEMISLYASPDLGTGKFIYSLPTEYFTDKSTHSKQWVTFEKDILPEIYKALELAWERGFLKDSRELSDYYLGGMNLGWEMPGTFDVGIMVKDFSIKTIKKQ